MTHVFVVTVEILAASVWIGGLVTVGLVAQIARRQLEPADSVGFFSALGRRHLKLGGGSLVVALASGAVLLADARWTSEKSAIAAVAAALVLVVVAGVAQARSLTALRRTALADPSEPALPEAIRRRARAAAGLRLLIGLLTIAVVVLAAVIIG